MDLRDHLQTTLGDACTLGLGRKLGGRRLVRPRDLEPRR
jgi:hypothetical protein